MSDTSTFQLISYVKTIAVLCILVIIHLLVSDAKLQ